jgi:hypothetical protein
MSNPNFPIFSMCFPIIIPLLLVILPSKTHRIHQASDGVACDVAFYGEVLGAMAWKDGIQRWPGRKCWMSHGNFTMKNP